MSRLFVFGLGYTSMALARRLRDKGWQVAGTVRDADKAARLNREGIEAVTFDGTAPGGDVAAALDGADHVLVSIPPGEDGDPVLGHHRAELAARARTLAWVGYLSTIGVYGDLGGAAADESTPAAPWNTRLRRRVIAESAWLAFGEDTQVPVCVFRIAGIYGPGRNALHSLRRGTARRIVKPGQVFNRIHVDDIATVLEASMARPRAGAIYNVADDEPAPPQDVIAHAARLMGVEPPPEIAFEDAELSPMARSFWAANKRVSNSRIREELGVSLACPTYREGLAALHAAGEGA